MKKVKNLKQTRSPQHILYAFLSLLLLSMPFTALADPGEEGEGKTPESFSLPVIETGFEESELVESELELEAWMTAPFESTFAEIEDRIEVEEWMSSPF